MKLRLLLLLPLVALSAGQSGPVGEERVSFQTSAPYSPRVHLDADVAMVYGFNRNLAERIESWRKPGYGIHFMTGVSWGNYQDYLYGKFDGRKHEDEEQMDKDGRPLRHGRSTDVFYMSPSESYGKYLASGIDKALELGVEAVHLEEPEFWVRSGYEPNFKREWKAYYGEDWQPPHSSPDAQYRASKLKYFLYRRALGQVFDSVHAYEKRAGRPVKCYVATHSLLNYSQWRIVSPMSSLIDVGCDGYIAQVWTGTARTPNYCSGVRKERTFETAFLEYGAMENLVRASGRRVWFLHDPVEDNPDHTWEDYRVNWESTVTASLLHSGVWRYEAMPWPDRVFNGTYPKSRDRSRPAKTSAKTESTPIPHAYETELQTAMRALGDMNQPANRVRWLIAGTQGAGIPVSDTLMFQRGDPDGSDHELGSFYGLALPLLERGLPVEPVQIESAAQPGFLDRYKLLLLTYEGQKPPTPEFHTALAAWVKKGGALVVIDDDRDPYLAVREWWNKPPLAYATPRLHLFEQIDRGIAAPGLYREGQGAVLWEKLSPAALSRQPGGDQKVRELAMRAAAAAGLAWKETAAIALQRGPYVIAAGSEGAPEGKAPPVLRGKYVNLFDAGLPVLTEVRLTPGRRLLLYDLNAPGSSAIAAAACRIRNERRTGRILQFRADGIAETTAALRMAAARAPSSVLANEKPLSQESWRFEDGTLFLTFPNAPEGVEIRVTMDR
jgi:hypothetical protein